MPYRFWGLLDSCLAASVILQHTETSGRFNGESYVEFLKQLLAYYYKGKIILIEDGAP